MKSDKRHDGERFPNALHSNIQKGIRVYHKGWSNPFEINNLRAAESAQYSCIISFHNSYKVQDKLTFFFSSMRSNLLSQEDMRVGISM